MSNIDKIENKIFDNQQRIRQLERETKSLLPQLIDAYMDKKGLVKNKTIVEFRGDKYLVNGIYCTETGVYSQGSWLTGYKIKKDGTPGSQIKTIYSGWKVVE